MRTPSIILGLPLGGLIEIYARQIIADDLIGTTGGNADTVDAYHAYATPTANNILALDSSGFFPKAVYPLALLTDGTRALTGNLSVNSGVTIDGVDISAHDGNTSKHHSSMSADDHTNYVHVSTARTITAQHSFSPGTAVAPFALGTNAQGVTVTGLKADQLNKSVSAGNGLSGGGALTSNISLAVSLKSTSGLEVDVNGLALADAIAGNGLAITNKVLAVGAGNGISVAADAVAVALKSTSGLELDGNGLALADTVAGNGLTVASKIISVGAGTLISVAADAVSLSVGTAQYQVPVTGASPFTPAYTLLSSFAGSGLTFTSAFDVAVGNGIQIAADAVAIKLATTSGLSVDANGLVLADTVAGNGLSITNKVIAVGAGTLMSVAADSIGLSNGTAQYQVPLTGTTPFTPSWTALSTLAGSGLTFSSGFDISVGNGIQISTDAVAIKLNATSGLSVDTNGLALADTIAGNGLTIASKVLSVGAGTLISVAADNVGLSNGTAQYQIPVTGAAPYTPSWTLLSTFAGDGLVFSAGTFAVNPGDGIQISTDKVAVKLQTTSGLILNSSTGLAVDPGSHITVDANGVSLTTSEAYTWTGAHTFQATMTSRKIQPEATNTYDLGGYDRLWSRVYASEIAAILFVQETASVLGGWLVITKDEGTFAATVGSADTTINFGKTMIQNDFVLVSGLDIAGAAKREYIKVGTLVSGTTYNVTRDLASAHGTDPSWSSGTVFIVLGQDGAGRIELNSYSTPRISLYKQGAAYNTATECVRIGDLNGWGPIGVEVYGWAAGDYSGNEYAYYAPATGMVIRGTINADDGYLKALIVSGTLDVSTAGVIKSGASGYDIGTGWWLDYNAGTPRLFIGNASGDKILWNGTSLTLTGDITADGGSIGGWTINSAYNAKDTGDANTSSGMAPTDYPFYAGATYANRASAPFRVTPAGALTATSATITGSITATSGSLSGLTVSGTLDVGTSGVIKSGATAYNSGTGWWLEFNGGTPRLFIGNSSGDKILWSGSALSIVGDITADGGAIAGWTINTASLAKDTGTDATSSGMYPVDYPFFAGATVANRATAPFRVTPAGALTASNASITGTIDANAGYLGGLDIDGILTIGSSGGIYQGTGTFASPTIGLKIWNSGGIGQIAGYNAGVAQWYAGTDGKLYGGGGTVVIDSNGLTVNAAGTDDNRIKYAYGGVTLLTVNARWVDTTIDIAYGGIALTPPAGDKGYLGFDVTTDGQLANSSISTSNGNYSAQVMVEAGGSGNSEVKIFGSLIQLYGASAGITDVKVDGGLLLGTLTGTPAVGELLATSHIRTDGGLYVGNKTGTVANDNIIADGLLDLGDRATAPATPSAGYGRIYSYNDAPYWTEDSGVKMNLEADTIPLNIHGFYYYNGAGTVVGWYTQIREFPNSGTPSFAFSSKFPFTWRNRTVYLDLFVAPKSTGTGNVVWEFTARTLKDAQSMASYAFSDTNNTAYACSGTTESRIVKHSINLTSSINWTYGHTREVCFAIEVTRDAAHANDTFAGSVWLAGAQLRVE